MELLIYEEAYRKARRGQGNVDIVCNLEQCQNSISIIEYGGHLVHSRDGERMNEAENQTHQHTAPGKNS